MKYGRWCPNYPLLGELLMFQFRDPVHGFIEISEDEVSTYKLDDPELIDKYRRVVYSS